MYDVIPVAVAAGSLILLAVAHSVLGEQGFVRPLLAAEWRLAEVPRPAADRILRVVWHAISVAWLGLAAVAVGAPPLTVTGLVAVLSGLLMLALVAAHFAWPVFLVGGMAALVADDAIPDVALVGAAGLAAASLVAVGVVHVYWAFGGRRGFRVAVPDGPDGEPAFVPGRWLTLAVAGALFVFAALVASRAAGLDHWLLTLAVGGGAAILAGRAVGDGGQAGFSKRDRSSDFARLDDRFFTPLVVLLAFGAVAALLV